MNVIVFDAGGLIALEGRDRRVALVLQAAIDECDSILIPATALAQVTRNSARQVRLWRLVYNEKTNVIPLDTSHARAVGFLLARTKTSDIVDAHVVVCAKESNAGVITSDSSDIARLDPTIPLVAV